METYDLSHPLSTGMPVYPGTDPVSVEPAATIETDGYRTTRLDLDSHAGTHVDAPAHFGMGPSLAELPVDRFQFEAAIADVRPLDDRESVGFEDVRDAIAVDHDDVDLVAVVTGWDRHWGTDRYFDHPFLTADAASWLAIRGLDLGVDAINPDPTPATNAGSDESDGFPAHETLFDHGRVIVENLRGLDRLPDRFRLDAYPLRFDGADASPVRAVAQVPEDTEQ